MSDVIKEYFDNTFEESEREMLAHNPTSRTDSTSLQDPQNAQAEPSTYTLASDQSRLSQRSRDVDLWLRGATANTGIQLSRNTITQRATSAHIPWFDTNGMWYVLALLLPFMSSNNYPQWRYCSPSVIISSAELLITQIGQLCHRVRCNIRRLAQNQMSREILATAMDVLLVAYAIGFLILSMYQGSIIG